MLLLFQIYAGVLLLKLKCPDAHKAFQFSLEFGGCRLKVVVKPRPQFFGHFVIEDTGKVVGVLLLTPGINDFGHVITLIDQSGESIDFLKVGPGLTARVAARVVQANVDVSSGAHDEVISSQSEPMAMSSMRVALWVLFVHYIKVFAFAKDIDEGENAPYFT